MPQVYSIQVELQGELFQFNLDATSEAVYTSSGQLTSYPIQDGSFVSDHYVNKPDTITLNGIISDIKSYGNRTAPDEGSAVYFRDTKSFINNINKFKRDKVPFTVQMGFDVITDLFITNFSATQNKSVGYWSDATQAYAVSLAFQKVRFGSLAQPIILNQDELGEAARTKAQVDSSAVLVTERRKTIEEKLRDLDVPAAIRRGNAGLGSTGG